MPRDTQLSKVYAWERIAYPQYATHNTLDPLQVRTLVYRILNDVRDAGGTACAPSAMRIAFNKRNGGSGKWDSLKFSPKFLPICHVLHEVAHALTWGAPPGSDNQDLHELEGHGSRFTACMVALIEHYAGLPAEPAFAAAKMFKMAGPSRRGRFLRTETHKGRQCNVYELIRTEKYASVNISRHAYNRWKDILRSASSTTQAARAA